MKKMQETAEKKCRNCRKIVDINTPRGSSDRTMTRCGNVPLILARQQTGGRGPLVSSRPRGQRRGGHRASGATRESGAKEKGPGNPVRWAGEGPYFTVPTQRPCRAEGKGTW